MNRFGYSLGQKAHSGIDPIKYREKDLLLMSTHQLREICREQKIISGVLNPMDRDNLVRVILDFRGAGEFDLIRTFRAEGISALERMLKKVKKNYLSAEALDIHAKITVFQGLPVEPSDGYAMQGGETLQDTNVLLVSGDAKVCGIFRVQKREGDQAAVYLTQTAEVPFVETDEKQYSLYCFDRASSDHVFRVYHGVETSPEYLNIYKIPLLDFIVRETAELEMPLAIDFGTSNTVAGTYLDSSYFERAGIAPQSAGRSEEGIRYVQFAEESEDVEDVALLPSVVGVIAAAGEQREYVFGYEALRLAEKSYFSKGFCIFCDMKRWACDFEKTEQMMDFSGHIIYIPRKDIIKAYLDYIIERACHQFKCRIKTLHISSPIKQKALFYTLYRTLYPQYMVSEEELIDEGMCVIYNTISDMMRRATLQENKKYKAMVIDCGGGTTDLCSSSFRVTDRKMSYKIEVETTYENGDTDFGGNNLTYRMMQLLKIKLALAYGYAPVQEVQTIFEDCDPADMEDISACYQKFDALYDGAEEFIPTRFREYEQRGYDDYFKVKNNFYYLFSTAEKVKKEFFRSPEIVQVCISSVAQTERFWSNLVIEQWKLAVRKKGQLEVIKDITPILCSISEAEAILKGDIYRIMEKFLDELYNDGALYDYEIIRLTGQSCKLGYFRDALKEFIPGKMIKSNSRERRDGGDRQIKRSCLSGAIKYLRDTRYGYAEITMQEHLPSQPYNIVALTHSGEEKTLLRGMQRDCAWGCISRSMNDLTLKLFLRDTNQEIRCGYTYRCNLDEFAQTSYEALALSSGHTLPQNEMDTIINGEVKFFVFAERSRWGFSVLPVLRSDHALQCGRAQFFAFENDSWVRNFFDGTK